MEESKNENNMDSKFIVSTINKFIELKFYDFNFFSLLCRIDKKDLIKINYDSNFLFYLFNEKQIIDITQK